MTETSTGLKENVAGVLCYVLGWVSGLVFILTEPENKFVRFHAFQSIAVFGFLTIISFILLQIPLVGGVISGIVWVVGFVLWILLMVMAAQEKKYKLSRAGDLAEKWAG